MLPYPKILKNVATDSSLALILVGLAGPLWYLSTLIMARLYGAEVMGTYFIAWNLVLILSGFCRLGLDLGLLRFAAILKAKGQLRDLKGLFWPALGFVTLLSSIAAVGMYASGEWLARLFHAPSLPAVLDFVAPAIPIFAASFVFRETIRSLGGVRWATFQKNILFNLTFIFILIILASIGTKVVGKYGTLGLAAFLSILVNLVFLAVCLKVFARHEETGQVQSSFKALLHYSWPLFLNYMFMMAFSAVDRLILGMFTSPQEVAYYEIAAKVGLIISLPLYAVNSVVPPLFAQFYELGDLNSLEMLAQRTSRWMYYMALPLALLLILLAPSLLGLFGPNFSNAYFAVSMLALAQLINVASGSVGFILNMTGHQWTVTISSITSGGSAMALMLILAATFGLNGLAVASALGITGFNILMAWAVWRRMKIKVFAVGIRWANLSALLGIILFFLTKPLVGPFIGAGFFILAYLIMAGKPIKQELAEALQYSRGKP